MLKIHSDVVDRCRTIIKRMTILHVMRINVILVWGKDDARLEEKKNDEEKRIKGLGRG